MAELVTKADLQAAFASLEAKMDNFSLRLTLRFGGMLVVAIGALVAVLKLT